MSDFGVLYIVSNVTSFNDTNNNSTSFRNIFIDNYDEPLNNYTYNDTAINYNDTTIEKEKEKNYWALILIWFPILTIFGNILVIASVYRERTLQTATNYFIVSLALADLLVAVVVMPFAVYVLSFPQRALPSYHNPDPDPEH
ncbi:hypothetical protein WDU94_008967 [Cyamophila willieti]